MPDVETADSEVQPDDNPLLTMGADAVSKLKYDPKMDTIEGVPGTEKPPEKKVVESPLSTPQKVEQKVDEKVVKEPPKKVDGEPQKPAGKADETTPKPPEPEKADYEK